MSLFRGWCISALSQLDVRIGFYTFWSRFNCLVRNVMRQQHDDLIFLEQSKIFISQRVCRLSLDFPYGYVFDLFGKRRLCCCCVTIWNSGWSSGIWRRYILKECVRPNARRRSLIPERALIRKKTYRFFHICMEEGHAYNGSLRRG